MLEFDWIEVQNFLSWGEQPTRLPLANMGQCLFVGVNGAGKTSLIQAILWTLSGRTMYTGKADNGVRNWFTNADTRTKLRFKDGSEVTRVLPAHGPAQLFYSKEGRDLVSGTLHTSSDLQESLNRELRFDYGVFCTSLIFAGNRKSWLSMNDQSRKKLMERIIGTDRIDIYGQVAKSRMQVVATERDKIVEKIRFLTQNLDVYREQLMAQQDSHQEFETNRDARHATKLESVKAEQAAIAELQIVDIEKLRAKWDIITSAKQKLEAIKVRKAELEAEVEKTKHKRSAAVVANTTKLAAIDVKLRNDIAAINNDASSRVNTIEAKRLAAQKQIQQKRVPLTNFKQSSVSQVADIDEFVATWHAREGKICSECEQNVATEHVHSKIEPKLAAKATLQTAIIDIAAKLAVLDGEITAANTDAAALTKDIKDGIETSIKSAKEQSAANKQQQQATHTQELVVLDATIGDLASKAATLSATITAATNKLDANTPKLTLKEAEAVGQQRKASLDRCAALTAEAEAVLVEANPHAVAIIATEKQISDCESKVASLTKTVAQYNTAYDHLYYIHKAYTERKKIRSYLTARRVPYFNSRIEHYLDHFGLDIQLSLTDTLGIESNLWGYDHQSDGQRCRTDIAFMLAQYDLHLAIHGPQANILILDEPEKGLDEVGVQALISIIKNELTIKFESIFIMSHRKSMQDMFPHQITIERSEQASQIVDIR